MKTLRLLAIASISCLIMISCTGKNEHSGKSITSDSIKETDENAMLRDSLDMAREYMNSLSTLVNEVSDGLTEIRRMEQIVSAPSFGQETADKRDQLRNDILLIKNSIQERQNRLAELEEKLTRSEANNKYNEESKKSMLQTIANLKQQLTDQQPAGDRPSGRKYHPLHDQTLEDRIQRKPPVRRRRVRDSDPEHAL